MLQESCSRIQWISMAAGEISGLKRREPVMADVLGGDFKDRLTD